jgi:Tol biopolymer transport system component
LIASGFQSAGGWFALYAVSLAGEVQKLTAPDVKSAGPGPGDLNPACAPDGKTVAFTRLLKGFGGQIYTLGLSPEGKAAEEPRAVSWAATDASSAAWTNDGRELVYQRVAKDGLWRTRAFEKSAVRHHRLELTGIENPAISRDGHSLVFSNGRSNLDIARSDISASLREPHTEPVISSTRLDMNAKLSPDGRRIVFDSERSGAQEIWIAGVDGSAPRQLTNFVNAVNGGPNWSPDGTWIAFDSHRDGQSQIYVARADQPEIRQVTTGSAENALPSWSRDGAWLYFSSNHEIWKASTSTFSDQRRVTSRGVGPVESPDGRYLYYTKREATGGPARLWRLRTSTGEEEPLLTSWYINHFDFVPEDEGVYFTNTPEANAERLLYFYDLGTGQVRRVACLPKSYFCCLDVSKDRRYAYYSVMDDLGHDLMIVQDFH